MNPIFEIKNVGFGYLNQRTETNEYDCFILVPLEVGKTAVFNPPVHALSGETIIDIDIVDADDGQQAAFAKHYYHLKPGLQNPMFNPEFCHIEIKVNLDLNQSNSAFIQYKDADDTDLGSDMEPDLVYNVAYVYLKVTESVIGAPILLSPKILLATKGYALSQIEQIVESTGESIRKTAFLLIKDSSAPTEIKAPAVINQWTYQEMPNIEGHFTAVALKADNAIEGATMLKNEINGTNDPIYLNKTRKGRVRKRRTATRNLAQNDQKKAEETEKKKEAKPPIRKGKVRKKYTRTRELDPVVTKPKES